MPRLGLEANIDNIDAKMLQKFVLNTVTPKKCVIVGTGVKRHEEFVDLVKERLGDYLPVPEHRFERESAKYIGGEVREWSESPNTNIILAFQSCPWKSEDLAAFYVINTLIGSATSFSAGGPGKGMYCRAITNLMQRFHFVEGVQSVSSHFSDTGLFGINISGPSSHAAELMYVIVEELNKLKLKVSDEELARAKNILKMNILMALERKEDRTEELARNFVTFGDLTFFHYL
mmetsp:Transcript_5624/g.4287  ORF Transcript_5624/g.4287 Transcript_5624/m.4287 type:complete len:232 (-) Transcript_5624:175-870(-)